MKKKIIVLLAMVLSAPAFAGTIYKFDVYGNCNEYGPSHIIVTGSVSKDYCRYTQGTEYKFDFYGNCNEYGPSHIIVTGSVSKDYCR